MIEVLPPEGMAPPPMQMHAPTGGQMAPGMGGPQMSGGHLLPQAQPLLPQMAPHHMPPQQAPHHMVAHAQQAQAPQLPQVPATLPHMSSNAPPDIRGMLKSSSLPALSNAILPEHGSSP